jgi:hypothetical protein
MPSPPNVGYEHGHHPDSTLTLHYASRLQERTKTCVSCQRPAVNLVATLPTATGCQLLYK